MGDLIGTIQAAKRAGIKFDSAHTAECFYERSMNAVQSVAMGAQILVPDSHASTVFFVTKQVLSNTFVRSGM